MAPHIQTPVEGFTGQVAGVHFANGVGDTDDPAALAYFERHGYDITLNSPPADGDTGSGLTPKQKLQVEAKSLGLSEEGTKDEIAARIAEHNAKTQTPPQDGGAGTPPADGEAGSGWEPS